MQEWNRCLIQVRCLYRITWEHLLKPFMLVLSPLELAMSQLRLCLKKLQHLFFTYSVTSHDEYALTTVFGRIKSVIDSPQSLYEIVVL